MGLHQSWGGWDSHTSSLGHDLHSTAGRREAGPVSCPWESKTLGARLALGWGGWPFINIIRKTGCVLYSWSPQSSGFWKIGWGSVTIVAAGVVVHWGFSCRLARTHTREWELSKTLRPHPTPRLSDGAVACSDPTLGLGQVQHRPAFSRGEVGRN